MEISLKGQVVLITGAGRGIGAAISRQFAMAEATLALHYRGSGAEAEALAAEGGPDSQAFQADLGQGHEAGRLAREVLARYGRVDVLVNNAGLALSMPLDQEEEAWLAGWQETLQVNLVAAAQLCKALIPAMAGQGGGRLVHIASRAAFRGDLPEYMAYAASKGGLVALSRSLARGYGRQGIKSFVVAPGFTRTEMAEQFIREHGEEIALRDLALSRLTRPEDVAPTVLFLASGLMDHATGCTIDINAGSYMR
jgi:NAD(P)-dependent dehydrogenase (short-subunit alcohol dehydrogenase family)